MYPHECPGLWLTTGRAAVAWLSSWLHIQTILNAIFFHSFWRCFLPGEKKRFVFLTKWKPNIFYREEISRRKSHSNSTQKNCQYFIGLRRKGKKSQPQALNSTQPSGFNIRETMHDLGGQQRVLSKGFASLVFSFSRSIRSENYFCIFSNSRVFVIFQHVIKPCNPFCKLIFWFGKFICF